MPGHVVRSKVRPLLVVDVAGSEQLLQAVLESLLWSPSLTMASGKFAEHDHLWKAMVFHSGNMTSPSELVFQDHGFDAGKTSACSKTSTLVMKSLQWMLRMVRRQRW